MERSAVLVEIAGDHVGKRHRLALPLTVLGRSSRSDIQLEQESVSRLHADLLTHEGQYVVRDRRSKNGTYVNACKVDERTLAEGDELEEGLTAPARPTPTRSNTCVTSSTGSPR